MSSTRLTPENLADIARVKEIDARLAVLEKSVDKSSSEELVRASWASPRRGPELKYSFSEPATLTPEAAVFIEALWPPGTMDLIEERNKQLKAYIEAEAKKTALLDERRTIFKRLLENEALACLSGVLHGWTKSNESN